MVQDIPVTPVVCCLVRLLPLKLHTNAAGLMNPLHLFSTGSSTQAMFSRQQENRKVQGKTSHHNLLSDPLQRDTITAATERSLVRVPSLPGGLRGAPSIVSLCGTISDPRACNIIGPLVYI